MKGKLNPGPLNALDPSSMAARVYTDAHDQDWNITIGATGGMLVARPTADAANYYGQATSYIAASAPNYDAIAEGLDAWVDQWAAGGNPRPQIVTDVTASKPTAGAGAGVIGLIILAVLVFSDKKHR